jgi:hypothetical protein
VRDEYRGDDEYQPAEQGQWATPAAGGVRDRWGPEEHADELPESSRQSPWD